MGLILPTRSVAPRPEKAVIGEGAGALMTLDPMWQAIRNPQQMMRMAQQVFHSDRWVRRAEETIDLAFATVAWHLEDENDEEIEGGKASEIQQRALDLLERPQAALPDRQNMTRSQLWSLTCRHMGLCGSAFWLLDQLDGAAHTPLACLYINPARMTPAEDAQGNLTGWVLDYRGPANPGIPLDLLEVIHFKLNEPDSGHFGIGIVESALATTALTRLGDTHAADVLTTGGRLAGIVSARQGGTIPDNVYQQLVRDFRVITDQPNAAKRTTVVQGPIEFTKTAATPAELDLIKLMTMSRDDTLDLWGVPLSQIGGYSPAGLNSGDVRKYDRQAFLENAVHPRLVQFGEPLQFQLLDRYQVLGATIEIVIDEPTFVDDSPRYAMAQMAQNSPLTNNQRLALVGLPPMPPELLGTSGLPLGDEVWLPANLVNITQPQGQPLPVEPAGNSHELEPARAEEETQLTEAAGETSEGKAAAPGIAASLKALRSSVTAGMQGRAKSAVAKFLAEQRSEIAALVRAHGAAIVSRKRDTSPWWPERKAREWDQRLAAALRPNMAGTAQAVATHLDGLLAKPALKPAGKAMAVPEAPSYLERLIESILAKGAARVTEINERTRQAIQRALEQGIDQGLGPGDLGDLIESQVVLDNGSPAFDEYRAEMIARTELETTYRDAEIGSYGELGVERVQAVDGIGDDMCAARNGQVFTLDDANSQDEHPNGTLDWLPWIE